MHSRVQGSLCGGKGVRPEGGKFLFEPRSEVFDCLGVSIRECLLTVESDGTVTIFRPVRLESGLDVGVLRSVVDGCSKCFGTRKDTREWKLWCSGS